MNPELFLLKKQQLLEDS